MREGRSQAPERHATRPWRPRALPALAAAAALFPLALLLWDTATGGLGAEPVAALMQRTGWWALTILVATLAVTPVRRLTGWNRLIQIRRTLGLIAFSYAVLHFLCYVVVDQWFAVRYIVEDIVERPFITAGFTAFLLLIPLAATSTRNAIRRMGGKRWQRLHRLIYPAAGLAVLHYFWLVKLDTTRPLIFAAIVAGLLLLRLRLPTATTRPDRDESRPRVEPSRPLPASRPISPRRAAR